jgi:hypothetical protein
VKKATPKAGGQPSVPASPSATDGADEEGDGAGNPITDGWNDIVDGVGDLLGIGGEPEATAAPEPSPTTEAPTATDPAATPTPTGAAPSATPSPSGGSASPTPSASSGSASPSPTPSLTDIPCLGPRVFKKAAEREAPQVSLKTGLMETASLTMYDPTYDGVAELKTARGTVRALKFSMSKAVNKPFRLTNTESGHTAVKNSTQLTALGDVRFYTTRFEGKLFGVIPVTFTPEAPPPLTLPVLWFTDAKIDLALVQCNTMIIDNLNQIDKS